MVSPSSPVVPSHPTKPAPYSVEESTSGESTDGYMTPDEYVQEADELPARHPDEDLRDALVEADELKAEGTEYFRAGKWVEALQTYRRGVAELPPRKEPSQVEKGKGKAEDRKDHEDEDDTTEGFRGENEDSVTPLSELDQEYAKTRSILNGNIGACHVKLGEHKEAVEACTQALLDDPKYVKALHRRAASNEAIGTWSSLSAAEEDYNTLLTLLPPASPLLPQTHLALRRVKPRREATQKAEMGEMMDKLKGLGNSVLGNFGLSTDNFKFEPNGQGGYSVNFAR